MALHLHLHDEPKPTPASPKLWQVGMATKPLLRQIELLQANFRESSAVQEQVGSSSEHSLYSSNTHGHHLPLIVTGKHRCSIGGSTKHVY